MCHSCNATGSQQKNGKDKEKKISSDLTRTRTAKLFKPDCIYFQLVICCSLNSVRSCACDSLSLFRSENCSKSLFWFSFFDFHTWQLRKKFISIVWIKRKKRKHSNTIEWIWNQKKIQKLEKLEKFVSTKFLTFGLAREQATGRARDPLQTPYGPGPCLERPQTNTRDAFACFIRISRLAGVHSIHEEDNRKLET